MRFRLGIASDATVIDKDRSSVAIPFVAGSKAKDPIRSRYPAI